MPCIRQRMDQSSAGCAKKGGITVTAWKVCIDATRKDHFPLPFIDHTLEKLSRALSLLFCGWIFGGTIRFQWHLTIKRIPLSHVPTVLLHTVGCLLICVTPLPLFGVAWWPSSLTWLRSSSRCSWTTFSLLQSSFDDCLEHLSLVLQRCTETNLVLNWENVNSCYRRALCWDTEFQQRGSRWTEKRFR